METIKTIIQTCIQILTININIFGYNISLATVAIAFGVMYLLLKFFYGFFSP